MSAKLPPVAEIEAILKAFLASEKSAHPPLGGMPTADRPAWIDKFEVETLDWMAHLMAVRLKRNRQSVPLISAADVDGFISAALDQANEASAFNGERLDPEELEIAKKFVINTVMFVIKVISKFDEDLYGFYRRKIHITCALAAEQVVGPVKFLASAGAADAVTRRLYTKEQYKARTARFLDDFLNFETIWRSVMAPLIADIGDLDDEEREDLEREAEAELKPAIVAQIAQQRQEAERALDRRVTRIYGAE